MKRYTELVKSLFQFRIYLLRPVSRFLGSRIVYYILKVYLRNIKMRPIRQRHLLPFPERIQTEVKQPLRLVFL